MSQYLIFVKQYPLKHLIDIVNTPRNNKAAMIAVLSTIISESNECSDPRILEYISDLPSFHHVPKMKRDKLLRSFEKVEILLRGYLSQFCEDVPDLKSEIVKIFEERTKK